MSQPALLPTDARHAAPPAADDARPKPPRVVESPFTVVIDSNEQIPYTFEGLPSNADQGGGPIRVHTRRESLTWGDYSIFGLPMIVVERKSKEDLYGTVSGTLKKQRHDFGVQLQAMASEYAAAAVVVECEWLSLLTEPPPFTQFNPKALARTIIGWMHRYRPVHWIFMPGRDAAEAFTYRYLEAFWRLYERGETFGQEAHERWIDAGRPGGPREGIDEFLGDGKGGA